MALVPCKECKSNVSESAATCPSCGKSLRVKKPTLLDRLQKVAAIVTALAIPTVGGIYTCTQKQKDDTWLKQQENERLAREDLERETRNAKEKTDRAVRLLEYLASKEEHQRRLSILLALGFAGQGQLPEGVLPVLVHAGSREPESEFAAEFKKALLVLRREARGDEKLLLRVNEAISQFYSTAVLELIEADDLPKAQQQLNQIGNALESGDRMTAKKALDDALQVAVNHPQLEGLHEKVGQWLQGVDSSKPKGLDPEDVDSAIWRHWRNGSARGELYSQNTVETDTPSVRLVVAYNDSSQIQSAENLRKAVKSELPDDYVWHFVNEDVGKLESKVKLPDSLEVRYQRDPEGQTEQKDRATLVLEMVRKILGDEGKLLPLGENLVGSHEVEVWFPAIARAQAN